MSGALFRGVLEVTWDYDDTIVLKVDSRHVRISGDQADRFASAIMQARKDQEARQLEAEIEKTKPLEDRIVERVLKRLEEKAAAEKNMQAAFDWVNGYGKERPSD